MRKSTILTITVVVLNLAAAKICLNLLVKHVTGTSGAAWFEAGCAEGEDKSTADCNAVLKSRYGYVPPKRDDEPPGTWHVPAAFLGLIYYSVLTLWFIGVGCVSRRRWWVHLFPLVVAGCGMASSIFYTYIMFTQLNEWCPWCMVAHVLNFFIAVCVVLMWPRGPKLAVADAAPPGRQGKPTPTVALATVHPSGRLLAMTVIAMLLVMFGEEQLLGRANLRNATAAANQNFEKCVATINRIKAAGDKLVKLWRLEDQHNIQLRQDDPIRKGSKPDERTWRIVVFSDFGCPPCKRTANFLEEQVQPLFAGRLDFVFKHFPLNSDCNTLVKSKMHKYACTGAAIAEAARILGGSDAFWATHDFLFANQELINKGQLTIEGVAVKLGFDPSLFMDTMQSKAVAKRVWDDVNQGGTYGLRGTPTVFVKGRKVDNLAVREIVFWDKLADMFWKEIGQDRPEQTKPSRETPTRDSQDQPTGP